MEFKEEEVLEWEKKNMNYWENPDCPKEYLEEQLIRLIDEVEGMPLPSDMFRKNDRENLAKQISFYEYASDK